MTTEPKTQAATPEWSAQVQQAISELRNASADDKRDAIEVIREDFGDVAAEHATRGLFSSTGVGEQTGIKSVPEIKSAGALPSSAELLARAKAGGPQPNADGATKPLATPLRRLAPSQTDQQKLLEIAKAPQRQLAPSAAPAETEATPEAAGRREIKPDSAIAARLIREAEAAAETEAEAAELADDRKRNFRQAKADGEVILNPKDPLNSAREFVRAHCQGANGKTNLWYWQGQFYQWNGVYYKQLDTEAVSGQVYAFLAGAKKHALNSSTPIMFSPQKANISEVIFALENTLVLPRDFAPPSWFDRREGEEGAGDVIAFRNGIVNIRTGEFAPSNSGLWIHTALDFDWDADALCPTWLKFLGEVFPDDPQSAYFIEEWMGYCMTDETRFQKAAMFIGRPRSGKGTITRVIQRLAGPKNCVGLNLDNWTRGENSQAPMLGKRVGVFNDVRLKPARGGPTWYDAGGLNHQSQSLILAITGEDQITIGRKFVGEWQGRLPIKFIMVSNEVPNLNDPTGALIKRFIKVHFRQSFLGRENENLEPQLAAELPGIARRCVDAYRRLSARHAFVQPDSATELEDEISADSDPFAVMAAECFVADREGGGQLPKPRAYMVFNQWCVENRRMDLFNTISANRLGKRLRALEGFSHLSEKRPDRWGQRNWVGIKLSPAWKNKGLT